MKIDWRSKRTWMVLGPLVVIALFLINDPYGPGTADLRWKEPVTLASGETIQVRRRMRFHQAYLWGVQQMSGKDITVSTIDVEGAGSSFERWSAPMVPFFLDRDPKSGEWVVIATFSIGKLYDSNGAPCPAQWAFRLKGGRWYLQPVPESLLGRKGNLLVSLRITDDRRFTGPNIRKTAVQRKQEQLSLPLGVLRPNRWVGDSLWREEYCKKFAKPQFTKDFFPESVLVRTYPRTEE